MHFDDGFGDGQTQSQPPEGTGGADVALLKAVEEPGKQRGVDAHAAVADFDHQQSRTEGRGLRAECTG